MTTITLIVDKKRYTTNTEDTTITKVSHPVFKAIEKIAWDEIKERKDLRKMYEEGYYTMAGAVEGAVFTLVEEMAENNHTSATVNSNLFWKYDLIALFE